jgi:hypothetical protein
MIAEESPFLSDEEKRLILAGNTERYVNQQLP